MLSALNYYDYFFLGFMLISSLLGLARGFWLQIISLIVWVGAAFVYYKLGPILTENFVSHLMPQEAANWVVMGGVFIIFFFIGLLLRWLAHTLFTVNGFTFFNKIMGLLLGFCISLVLILIMVYAVNHSQIATQTAWKQSLTVERMTDIINHYDDYMHGINNRGIDGDSIKHPEQLPEGEYARELA